MIYLDQPAGVGYSISSSRDPVQSTWEAAKDFYAFAQLFLTRFPEYSQLPFHIAAESHGGQYAPNFATYIDRLNKVAAPSHLRISLDSIIIMNGMMSASIQGATSPEYACDGPYAFWENGGVQCSLLRSKVLVLKRVMRQCRDFQTPLTCVPAGVYALSAFEDRFKELGLNVYDVRKRCSKELECYDEIAWIQTYLNKTSVKLALGVPPDHHYSLISWEVNRAFMRAGDVTNDASPMASELTESGVRILNVAGDADFVCNFMGSFEWMYQLNSPYKEEFRALNNTVWRNTNGKAIGEVRAAGAHKGTASGMLTWLRVYEAGHMVPHDQPETALEFFKRQDHNFILR
ncbi:hypothetical protein FRC12_016878 [Ceratobasidium sp. 428]|nr:hypothetical protein FRC12_016878 [Ceratobasidium sp. 428]